MSKPHSKPPKELSLRFLFIGGEKPWKIMEGFPKKTGKFFEVRSLPGGQVAWGKTPDEAEERLKRTIDASLEYAEKKGISPLKWYQQAIAVLGDDDVADFKEGWFQVLHRAIPFQKADGFEFVQMPAELICT